MEGRSAETVDFLRERYEARIKQLVSLVLSTKEEISRDAVIGVMKGDAITQGFASQRSKEVWENVLAKEREATISSLITELSESRQATRQLEEQLSLSHRSALSAEEKASTLTQETEKLYEKASQSAQHYEEVITKRQLEIAKLKTEIDGLKAENGKIKAEIDQKSEEIDAIYSELDESRAKNSHLQQDFDSLSAKLNRAEELQRFREALNTEYQDRESSMQEQSRRAAEDLIRAGKELRESQAAQIRLETQLKQQGELHKKQVDALTKLHSEAESSTEQQYESELQSLRTKLASSQLQNQSLEMQLEELSRSLAALKERTTHETATLRSELDREKTVSDRHRDDLERYYAQREADLTTDHGKEIEALHKHYKEVVMDRSKNWQKEADEERERLKFTEKTLREKLSTALTNLQENYLLKTDHEAILCEKDSAYRENIQQITAEMDSIAQRRLTEEIEKLTKAMQAATDQLTSKLTQAENSQNSLLSDNKKLSEELQSAAQKLNKLKGRYREVDRELGDMQQMYSEKVVELGRANKEVEDMTFELADVRREYAEMREKLGKAMVDVHSLQDRLRDQEIAHKAQLATQAANEREQSRLLQEELDQCQSLNEQLELELQQYKQLAQQMEEERDTALSESTQREAQAHDALRSVRSEEMARTSAHLRLHAEVKDKLSSTESALSTALSDLSALQSAHTLLSAGKKQAEEQLNKAAQRVAELELAIRQSGKQHKEIKLKAEKSRKSLKTIVQSHSKIVRNVKQKYRSELNSLQTAIFQELQEYKKSLSTLTSRCVIGLDDKAIQIQRKHQNEVIAFQEQTESVQKRFERAKIEAKDYINSLKIEHDSEVVILKEEKQELLRQIQAGENERKSLVYHLDKTRQELLRQETAGREVQEQVRKLQGEVVHLKDRTKAESEGKAKAVEAEWQKALERKEAELMRERDSIAQLKSELSAQHSSHQSESTQLITLFKQKLTDKESALESLRLTNKQQMEEISQLRSDILHLKRRTEGPLASLHSEVENLVEGLKLEQIRYRNQLVLKDKEIEELKNQLRKDTEMLRSVTELRRFDDGESRRDQSMGLSLSQLTPGRK